MPESLGFCRASEIRACKRHFPLGPLLLTLQKSFRPERQCAREGTSYGISSGRLFLYAQKPARRCLNTATMVAPQTVQHVSEASRFAFSVANGSRFVFSVPLCLFKTSKAGRFAYQASFVLKPILTMDCLNHSRGLPAHERLS